MYKIEPEILSKINEYLEFDISIINKSLHYMDTNYLVFGGSIRDILSFGKIKNDIDILVKPDSFRLFIDILTQTGWKSYEYIKKDILDAYKLQRLIFEPHIFEKNGKMVQLIRPSDYNYFNKIVQNVDISCCGVSFNGNVLIENVEGAILDCINRRFRIINENEMYNHNRIHNRIEKHLLYGLKLYEESNRRKNLDNILHTNDITFEYVKGYKSNIVPTSKKTREPFEYPIEPFF